MHIYLTMSNNEKEIASPEFFKVINFLLVPPAGLELMQLLYFLYDYLKTYLQTQAVMLPRS